MGYAVLTADPGTTIPVGSALFTYTNSKGTLVSQTGVAAAEPILSGRIFVDEANTQTGIALVNPSLQNASITLILRDATGKEFDRKTQSLAAGKHLATYVAQLFANLASGFTGSLTFERDQKIAAIALRESRNAQGEPLYTTLPVVDLGAAVGTQSVVFPQIAIGQGFSTRLIFINADKSKLASGKMNFYQSDASAMTVSLGGKSDSQFSYEVAASGGRQFLPGNTAKVASISILDLSSNLTTKEVTVNKGNLWVVDTGNHTIRRINLTTKVVETIAGKAGSAGWVDATGDAARFSSPIGIALETESLAQQREREQKGEAAPPVSVLVADTGNGVLRRVKTTGEVETLRSGGNTSPALRKQNPARSAIATTSALSFTSPTGIAVDPFGNVYVSEPSADRVKTILTNGQVVAAAQAKTFTSPKGITVAESGKVVITDQTRSGQEITYGGPQITSITPKEIGNKGGDKITIKGKNFASETVIVVAGVVVSGLAISDTETISFTAPALPSGRVTLTVQNRAGLAQTLLVIDPVPLSELPAGYITAVAAGSTFLGEGDSALSAAIVPNAVALDSAGNLYVADGNVRIRRVDARTGIVTTVAGSGQLGFDGDGGPATAAKLHTPAGLAIDPSGNLYITDRQNHRIRKIDAQTGTITTVVGTGQSGSSGDNGPAPAAYFIPTFVILNSKGNLLVSDFGGRVRGIRGPLP